MSTVSKPRLAPLWLAKWLVICGLVGLAVGAASAGFLASLAFTSRFREAHPWLILALPVVGFLVALGYEKFGKGAERGNNLLIATLHQPEERVPFRMAPMIYVATCLTHLCGGSAGREGTALQMGGAIADQLARPFRLNAEERKLLMAAGVAAGFGSVFGTPLAGAVFALEFAVAGKISHKALFPALVAAVVGDWTTRALGIAHERLVISVIPPLTPVGLLWMLVAGIAFGACAVLFCKTMDTTMELGVRYVRYAPLRPVIGGVVLVALTLLVGTTRYNGLGTAAIAEAFSGPVPLEDFALKALFTIVTLGSGFRGGEVTPLFFIGATLGNALSAVLPLPAPLLAGAGFVAVFAGASNAPLACIVLAFELFGAECGPWAALACVTAWLVSGNTSLYRNQRHSGTKLVA